MTNQTEATPAEFSLQTAIAADASTRFSFERTLLSHERTLMAWVRTATSLITFGFTLYKFFQLEIGASVQPRTHQVIGPREFAMLMIAIGLLALLLATIQNWQYRQHLRRQHLEVPLSLSSVVGALVSALGLLAMLAAIFRW
jgi:putative membrane protein